MFDIQGIAGSIMGIFIIIVVSLFFVVIFGVLIWAYLSYKRYSEYRCVIFKMDGLGNVRYSEDKGGIFVDKKTNEKRLYLKKNNVGLNPDRIPFVESGKIKTVFLFQTGLKNFQYVKMDFMSEEGSKCKVGEEDVNWAINSYERQKKLFSSSRLMQLMPYMALVFTGLVIMIVFIYFFKEFGVLKDVAVELKTAAQAIAQAKGGGVIIP